MWKPRYVVIKRASIPGPPIPPDEPCIVVRGQDVLAVKIHDDYVALYQDLEGADPKVLEELEGHRAALVAWQEAHPDKVKVADR
jgi:hypothetical protein